MKCVCRHPREWHEPNDLYRQNAEKYNESANGICSVRKCSCSKFRDVNASDGGAGVRGPVLMSPYASMAAELLDPEQRNRGTRDAYAEFLASKFKFSKACGFDVEKSEVHPLLHRHQPDIVQWAVRKGRCAIFASFGMGKTFMQLEILRLLAGRDAGAYLIIAPLGVRTEFAKDAAKLGIEYQFIRRSEEVAGDGLYLTNYESVRDGKLDPALFKGVSLDEASVLRSYGSKTYQEFLAQFGDTPYRFVATATPSPNRYKELIHYAGFLGVMDTGQALTRFFQRDSTQANNLTLYPHMEKEFHLWLHSWAVFIQKPSDLGYSDEGYDLPPIEYFRDGLRYLRAAEMEVDAPSLFDVLPAEVVA